MEFQTLCSALLKAETILIPICGIRHISKIDFSQKYQELLAASIVVILGLSQGVAVYYGWGVSSKLLPLEACQFALTLAFIQIIYALYFKNKTE